jgi:hypothetical protein
MTYAAHAIEIYRRVRKVSLSLILHRSYTYVHLPRIVDDSVEFRFVRILSAAALTDPSGALVIQLQQLKSILNVTR